MGAGGGKCGTGILPVIPFLKARNDRALLFGCGTGGGPVQLFAALKHISTKDTGLHPGTASAHRTVRVPCNCRAAASGPVARVRGCSLDGPRYGPERPSFCGNGRSARPGAGGRRGRGVDTTMDGLRFPFSELVQETQALKKIAKDFLDPSCTWALDQMASNLKSLWVAGDQARTLELQALRTKPSKGA